MFIFSGPVVRRRALRRFAWWLARFAVDRRASTALIFSFSLPVFLIGTAVAVDFGRALSLKSALQNAADMAALAGAQQLAIAMMTDGQVVSATQAVALSNLGTPGAQAKAGGPKVAVQILNNRSTVQVAISDLASDTFGNVTGMPTTTVSATASATLKGRTQLCLLALDPSSGNALSLDANAQIGAAQCSAYANSNNPSGLASTGAAVLTTGRTCTVGGFSGTAANFSPMPLTGCPTHADPLASLTPPSYSAAQCDQTNYKNNGTATLSPGTYCGGAQFAGNANITLQPGTYIFDNNVALKGNATLTGQNVTLYFVGSSGTFKADPNTTINLTAAKTGPWAGILLYEDPTASARRDWHISSNNARNLLGTIYLPQGILTVDSNAKVADLSSYTVIIANDLKVTGNANLTLNAMYSQTDVPVPSGLGPSGSSVQLTQ